MMTNNPQPWPPVADPKPRKYHNPHWKRVIAHWSRWLHIYLSMVSFAILFFFALTGITLNHQDRFPSQAKTSHYQGAMNVAWLNPAPGKDAARLEIVEYLRKTHGVKAALSDFRVDDHQLEVSFKGPGYEADVFIDRNTGMYEVTESRLGLVAIVNDLHKGRDTGEAWSNVIDVSAVLMCLVSMSGLMLIFFLHKRRVSGLLALAIGALLCVIVYRIWVP
jgi:uncharacterized protein